MNTRRLRIAVSVLSGLFIAVNSALAQTWIPMGGPPGRAVASSADGTKLVVVVGGGFPGGQIFTSTNSGVTWTPTTAPIANWFAVASSADGTRLLATAAAERPIYLSADSGATWTAATNELYAWYLSSAASSADGKELFVGQYDGVHRFGGMAASTDFGATWTVGGPDAVSVATSADGTKILVGEGPCFGCGFSAWFGISTNSGATWMGTSVPSSFGWNAVAASADGSRLVAVNADGSGFVYTSKDSGATWTTNSGPSGSWISVASSADGIKLVAAQGGCCNPGGPSGGGPVYTSSDSGATWASNNVPDGFAVASSADGGKLVAVGGGGIWTWQSIPTLALHITPSGNDRVLSWIVPSMDFVLQENSDLTTPNWTDVTNTSTLNLTNLQNEVVLSSTNGSRFYRLKH